MIAKNIDQVGIELYSGWKACKLRELTKLITKGTTPSSLGGKFIDKGINYIKSEAVSYDGKIDTSTFVFIDEEMHNKLKRSQLAKNDILYSMAGIFLGKNGLVTEDMLPANTNQALAIIRLKQEIANPKFIHYYLRQKSVIDFVNNMSGQSAQPNINFEEIKAIDIFLPPMEEQISIAAILTSLDDKIDLLHRQNKTLEQLAETLFRQWFVEEAEIEFHSIKNFVDVIDNRGKTPPFSDIKTDFPIVEVKSLSNNHRFVNYEACEKYVNEETYKNWFRKGHPIKNDILISTVGSIGEMAFVIENKGGIAQNVIGLRAKNISPFYLYQFLSLPKTRREIKDLDIGAVQPSIKVPHLLDIDVPIPKRKNVTVEFEKQLIPMFEKMKVNHFQIKTLTQTRDTLLPKLMSGEIRVTL